MQGFEMMPSRGCLFLGLAILIGIGVLIGLGIAYYL